MQTLSMVLVVLALVLGSDSPSVAEAPTNNTETTKETEKTLESLIGKLSDKDPKVRFEAAIEIGKLGPKGKPAVRELARLLKDPAPNVRMAAAQALGMIGPEARDAIPALVDALMDTSMTGSDFPVWVPVHVALGKIGPEAVRPVLDLLARPEKQAQIAAANTLGAIGPAAKEAVGPLVAILAKDDPDTRTAMMAGLIGIGPDAKDAVPILIKMLDSKDFHTQYWSQRALASIGPAAKPAVPKLIELITQGVVSVRRHSAIALGAIGPGIGQEGVQALTVALNDIREPVREDAVVALGKLGDFAKSAEPTLRKVLASGKLKARVEGARTLWIFSHDTETVVSVLVDVAMDDINQTEAACNLLAELGPPAQKALPTLQKILINGEPEAKLAAAKAIARIAPESKPDEKAAKP